MMRVGEAVEGLEDLFGGFDLSDDDLDPFQRWLLFRRLGGAISVEAIGRQARAEAGACGHIDSQIGRLDNQRFSPGRLHQIHGVGACELHCSPVESITRTAADQHDAG